MHKIFFITFVTFSILLSSTVLGQEKNGERRHFDREAFHAKRNAYITAEVGLTPEEASLFIPLCDELQRKMFEAGHDCRKLSKEMKSKQKATDAEYTKVIDACLDVKLNEARLEKEYYEKFKAILSPEKLYKYKNAEYKFAREFMRGSKEGRDKRDQREK